MANSARIDELQRKFAENPRRYFAPLANEYRKNGNLEQAILICQEYLPQQPGHMSGHIVYGQTLYEAGRFAEARAVFETALTLDPENLIALHHLGDIAREFGDAEAARNWYRRVLETDPRNEEINQLLDQLESATPAVAAAADTEQEFANAEGPAATSLATDVPSVSNFEPTAVPPIPTPPASVPEELLGFEPTSVESSTLELTEPDALEPIQTAPTRHEEASLPTSVDSGDLELIPTNAARVEESSGEAAAAEPEERQEERIEARDEESGAEEEITFADTAVSDVTSSTEAAMLDAELFGEEADLAPVEEEGSRLELAAGEPSGATTDIEREVDIFEAPTQVPETNALVGEGSITPPSLTLPAAEEAIASEPVPETAPIDGGHDGQEVTTAASEVFLTETMADLYLRQGHLESALEIFRRLAAQRPGDARLGDRLRAVEDLLFGTTVELEAPTAATEAVPTAPASPVTAVEAVPPSANAAPAGPTIREFLAEILARRAYPESTPAAPETAAAAPADEAAPETAMPVAESPRATPESSESVDPLEALFPDATPSDDTVTAATVLADAFADDYAEAPPLEGVPAHRASDELSLDHVFRTNTPAQGSESVDSFSFDRFFSEENVEPAPSPSEPQQNPTSSLDDIAQFNAWLSGLKKT